MMLNNCHLTWIIDARMMINPCHSLHPVQHLRGQPGEARWLLSALRMSGTKTSHSGLGIPHHKTYAQSIKATLILYLAPFCQSIINSGPPESPPQ